MSIFQLWLVTSLLPSLNTWANTTFLMTMFGFCLYAAWFYISERWDETGPDGNPLRLNWRPWLWVWVVSGVVCSVIPSRSDLYLIVGGYAATQSAEVRALPDNVLKAANAWLESVQKDATKDQGDK